MHSIPNRNRPVFFFSMKILDGSPGFGAPLNEQETLHFLATGKLNVHLGTVDEKGYPNVHPAWYYYDSANNGIYVETSTKQGKKTDNLRKDGNVYSSIDDPNPPYKAYPEKEV